VCKYGAAKPSRPHLVLNGPEALQLRPPHIPFDRAEERFMNALLLLGILMVSAYDSFYRDIAQAVATSLQVSSQVMVQRMVRRQGCWLEHHFATGGRFLHIWSSWRRPVNISS